MHLCDAAAAAAIDCCWLQATGCSAATTSPTNATARPENQGHDPSTSLPRAGSRYLDGVRVHVSAQVRDLRPLDVLDLLAILTKAGARAESAPWRGLGRRFRWRYAASSVLHGHTPCKTGSVGTRYPGTRRARGSCRIELAQTSRPYQRRSCLPQAGQQWDWVRPRPLLRALS